MSAQLVRQEILTFLRTSDPSVLCIRGRWGVGKTFTWNRALLETRQDKSHSLKDYAYVSLFGMNSLEDVKSAIFENTVQLPKPDIAPSLESLRENILRLGKGWRSIGRIGTWATTRSTWLRNYVGPFGLLCFASVTDRIICIDDIERRGKDLHVSDVLGLASYLKENRRCKIALILNDEALESQEDDFRKYFEKVVDVSLSFTPTNRECIEIGLRDETPDDIYLAECCGKLNISNIRVLRKIAHLVERCKPLLQAYDKSVTRQAIHSIALLSWCIHEPHLAPPLSYLTDGKRFVIGKGKEDVPKDQAAWNSLLDHYEFGPLDDFNFVLLDGIKNGFFDASDGWDPRMRSQRTLQPGERIRVLVVDDSVVIRQLVSQVLAEDPLLEVVGVAANGAIALQRIPQLNPDVLTLDMEMPELDGLETLRHLRRDYPQLRSQLRVIMFSTLTERGASATLDALTLGADDYVTKSSNEGSLDRSMARLRDELIPKVKQFFCLPGQAQAPPASPPLAAASPSTKVRPRVLAIGVSTGGPTALGALLPKLPAGFPLPVLVVQHMPPLFTQLLAERLHVTCQLPAEEAQPGKTVEAGRILIAPGDFHLKVASVDGVPRVCLDQSPPLNSCRPAVDALFSSIAEVYGGAVIAVVLTGMGQDGLRGVEILRAQGARILVQDEATSVVWGMPGAVARAGLADRILPLDEVVPEILRLSGRW